MLCTESSMSLCNRERTAVTHFIVYWTWNEFVSICDKLSYHLRNILGIAAIVPSNTMVKRLRSSELSSFCSMRQWHHFGCHWSHFQILLSACKNRGPSVGSWFVNMPHPHWHQRLIHCSLWIPSWGKEWCTFPMIRGKKKLIVTHTMHHFPSTRSWDLIAWHYPVLLYPRDCSKSCNPSSWNTWTSRAFQSQTCSLIMLLYSLPWSHPQKFLQPSLCGTDLAQHQAPQQPRPPKPAFLSGGRWPKRHPPTSNPWVRSLHVNDLLFESENGMACRNLMNTHRFQQIFNEVASKLIMKWYCETKYFDSQTVGFISAVTLLVTYAIIMLFHVVTVKISLCVRTQITGCFSFQFQM